MDNHFVYLLAGLFFLLIWLILFITNKKVRREMLVVSGVFLPVAPFLEWIHLKDYWLPQYIIGNIFGVEDFILAFSFGGIASVIYEVVLHKEAKIAKDYDFFKKKSKYWIYYLLALIAVNLQIYAFLFYIIRVPVFYALVIALFFLGLYEVVRRKDLLADALYSGLFMSFIFLIYYFVFFLRLYPSLVERWLQISSLGDSFFLGVIPLEEIIWAFAVGFMLGPIYEFVRNYELRPEKK